MAKEAEIVKLAFELFLKERRKADVARILNQRGYRSRQGKPWSGMTITRRLTDSSAIGEYRDEKTGNVIECQPIVTREIWDKVQGLLAEQKDPEKRPSGKVAHALSGLVVCGACGLKMYPREGRFLCEGCRNKIPIEDLEGIFIAELEEFWTERSPSGLPSTLKESWPAMEARERRNLAESLVEKFVIGDTDIEIRYKFPDFLKEPTKDAQIKPASAKSGATPTKEPDYIRLPKQGELCPYSGMTKSKLNTLILRTKSNGYSPPVRSKKVIDKGKTRGVRLIELASLRTYIENQGE